MNRSRSIALLLVLLLIAVIGCALVYMRHGFSARAQPLAVEAFLARRVRLLAIPRGASELRNPITQSAEVLAEGRAHFADHCASCHANNGSGETDIGRGLYPQAPDMRLDDTQDLSDGALFYIIENGVRFTGMPAWGSGSPEDNEASWKLVHFIRRLPKLTEGEIRAMKSMNPMSLQEMREQEQERRFLAGESPPRPQTDRH